VIEEHPRSGERALLGDLRRARRRRRTQDIDAFEALYRAYVTAIVVAVSIWLLSGVTGDHRVGAATVKDAISYGPQVVGAALAAVIAVGLRSGGRGGPLVIEAADVRHVLLSPVDRRVALSSPAVRQLRFAALVGAGTGTVAGLLAFRRLPGQAAAWLAAGAVVGTVGALAALGSAMVVSGRRLGRVVGTGLAVLVLGWAAADLATGETTAPTTLVGDVALWPLRVRPVGLVGVVLALLVTAAGYLSVGGTSIEASERRAVLVGQLRFAATLRDLRTVVVLRRQLAQEQPRQRPWLRMPRTIAGLGPGATPASVRVVSRHGPVWRRGWHGILRFPGARVARLAVCGAVAGAAAVGAWRGTTPLVVVAGLAVYVAGLDAVEPLAQEMDHPDRRDELPRPAGALLVRHLGAPLGLMAVVGAVGAAVGIVVAGGSPLAVEMAAAVALPAAWAGLAGATISVVQGAPNLLSTTDSLLPPEAAGARAIARTAWPPLFAIGGVLPVVAGRHVGAGRSPWPAVAATCVLVLVAEGLVGIWVRWREPIHRWFRQWLEAAKNDAGLGGGRSR
jgi:hypothetical protein